MKDKPLQISLVFGRWPAKKYNVIASINSNSNSSDASSNNNNNNNSNSKNSSNNSSNNNNNNSNNNISFTRSGKVLILVG